jgi:hypothetical protein
VNGDGLAKELKLFMEGNRMSLGNQFRSTDLVALENFASAKALMDETLEGEVREAALRIVGEVSSPKKVLYQLLDNRYVLHHGNWRGDVDFLIGYSLPNENPDDPVWVGIRIFSNPASSVHKQVTEAFLGWSAGAGRDWKSDGLDDETAWSSIRKGKALQALMGEADHIRAIKNHLLAILKEVEAFHNKYPELHWGVMEESIAGKGDHDLSDNDPLPIELPPETVPHLGT